MLMMLASVQDQKAFEKLAKQLDDQVGDVYVWTPAPAKEIELDDPNAPDPQFDRSGFEELRASIRSGVM